jgi:hypothetical protein
MAQIGTAAGFVTNGLLGTLTVTKFGETNYRASADYSAIGVSLFTVLVFSSNGGLLGTFTNLPGGGLTNYGMMTTIGGATNANSMTNTNTTNGTMTVPPQPIGDFSTKTTTTFIGTTIVSNVARLYFLWQGAPSNMVVTAQQLTASEVPSITMTAVGYLPSAIGLSRSNQNLALQWFGTSALQQSFDLLNWSNLSGATSPYIAPVSGTNQFFRLLETNAF